MKSVLIYNLNKEDLIFGEYAQDWCILPYPGHPKGCPNYNKKDYCPPKTPLINKIITPPYKLVAVKFNLKRHVKKMKEKHPEWTDRQARCVLYWQKKAEKNLRKESEKAAEKIEESKIIYKPEAYGVNLFATCRKIRLNLEKNPRNTVWKISIIGKKLF